MKPAFKVPRQAWFAVFGVALLIALGWVATRSGPLAPIRVTATAIERGDVSPSLFGIGTVEARRAYFIGPTAAGRVSQVMVDVGDAVKAGQLLVEMDPVDLDARVTASAAAVARAGSAVATAQAHVRDAKSRRELASNEARRQVELAQKGFVSPSAVDEKLHQKQSADAQLAAAESALASARQDLARLRADLQAVKQQRANFRLEAPADGVVTSRDAEPGSTVVAGQAVLKLFDPASLWITVRLDQSRSSGLTAGLPAEIRLRSRFPQSFAGKVARVEPVSDSVTEERIAQVTFDTLPQGLSTGEMAEVTLHLPTVRDALVLPNAALRHRGARTGVWLHDNGQLHFAPVETGAESLDGKVQIIDGLEPGDAVIVYSERDLKDGSRIKVVSALVGKSQ